MNIAVIGCGYVGVTCGLCFAELGHKVVCVDTDAEKIALLHNNIIPFHEPMLTTLLLKHTELSHIRFTHDIQDATHTSDVIFIAVGTPLTNSAQINLEYFYASLNDIAQGMKSYKVIAIKSTVPIGTTNKAKEYLSALTKGHVEFDILSNPEFLREGQAVTDFMEPDFIVIGTDSERARTIMHQLYAPLTQKYPELILNMDSVSAEISKYASNSFKATRISFINEFSGICEQFGGDIQHIQQCLTKTLTQDFLKAGIGYGGSCFPKDIQTLIHHGEHHNKPLHILKAVQHVNQEQRKHFIHIILTHYKHKIEGLCFALWGLSFKPNTDDVREAPALYIIQELLAKGARIQAYDPAAGRNIQELFSQSQHLIVVPNKYEALTGAHALCLITEWQEFKTIDFKEARTRMINPTIFDGRNQYELKDMQAAGFNYISLGRPSVSPNTQ